jgi:hypothetical protein
MTFLILLKSPCSPLRPTAEISDQPAEETGKRKRLPQGPYGVGWGWSLEGTNGSCSSPDGRWQTAQ